MILKDELFKASTRVSPVGVFRTDPNGLCHFVNAGWSEITGLSFEEAQGDGWTRGLHPEDQDRVAKAWSEAADKGLPFRCEYRFQRADGKITWVLGQAEAQRDSLGDVSGFIGTISDLTETKRTEERLKSSHLLLSAIQNVQTHYIANRGKKLIFDEFLGEVLKLTQSEFGFIGEIFHTSEGKPYLKTHTITNIAWNVETQKLYDKDSDIGMEFHNLETLFGAVIVTGKPVIANDAAKDPRSGGLPTGHPTLNAFLGLPFFNGEKMTGMVGLANRPGGYDEEMMDFLQPFLSTCSKLLLASKNEDRRKHAEKALKESQKKYKLINEQMRLILEGTSAFSGEKFLQSLVRQLARALKVRYALVGELTGDRKEKIHTLALWSDGKFEKNLEYAKANTPCAKVLEGRFFCFPKDVKKIFPKDKYLVERGVESYMGIPLFDSFGQLIGILNVFHDRPLVGSFNGQMILSTFAARAQMEIQRQKAEDALKESEQRFKDVLDNATSVVYIKDLEGRYLQVNRQYEKLMHLDKNQIVGKIDHDIFPKEVADAFTANDRKVIVAEKPIEVEEEIQWEDGLHTYISIKFPLKDFQGNIYAVCGISTDITKRKQAQARVEGQNKILQLMATGHPLQKTLERLAVLVEEQIPETFCSILLMDDLGQRLLAGASPNLPKAYSEAIDGVVIGPSAGCCGRAAYFKELVITEDIAVDPNWKAFKKIPLRHGLKACWSFPVLGSGEKVLGTFCIYYKVIRRPSQRDLDLSKLFAHLAGLAIERQQTEEQIQRSLEEKELLLKEIHHRTKNNMQIVSSLLWLQSKDIQDGQSREMFRDCSNRVLSMALVHEKMYESPNFLGVDYKKYLVSLVGELLASHGLQPDQVKFTVETNDLSLDLKSGIPCGLLIQELVSNSLKHAFPDGKKGEIQISLRPLNKKKIELVVSDSGVGFPEGFDLHNSKSLGLQLVTMLVEKQLGGTIEFNRNGRSEFKLVFEKGKP
ncbi:MAG: hypothetical protein NPINA01_19390 [Nitrospinaceae bacterium]|nr:MAG: hypothetical protein NPINA01_19390 [Nitrospinaceae bacterium]